MKRSAVVVNNLFLVFGICCVLFYLGCGLAVRFGQSLLFLWPMLGAVCIARWLLWKRAWKQGKEHPFPDWMLWAIRVIVLLWVVLFLFVEYFIVSSAVKKPEDGLDAIIVLGARVNEDGPSGSLRERIDTAADYLRRNPGTIAVVSGGQGAKSRPRCGAFNDRGGDLDNRRAERKLPIPSDNRILRLAD